MDLSALENEFIVGRCYTRRGVRVTLGLPDAKGGPWANGHVKHDGATFIFATVRDITSGGYDYDNRFVDRLFHWQTAGNVRQGTPTFRAMVDGSPVLVFTRAGRRELFVFRGFAKALRWEGNLPVDVVFEVSDLIETDTPSAARVAEPVAAYASAPTAMPTTVNHAIVCSVCRLDLTARFGTRAAGIVCRVHPTDENEKPRLLCPTCAAWVDSYAPPLNPDHARVILLGRLAHTKGSGES